MTTVTIAIFAVIAGCVMWFMLPQSLTAYAIGIVAGLSFTISSLRILGYKARKSVIASAIFHKITKYRVAVYNIPREVPQTISATVHDDGHDYTQLISILRNQMNFKTTTAKEAAQYALSVGNGEPLQEKVRIALQYVDSEKSVSVKS